MTNITTLRPGEHFMFKNFEWVCLDPNHPDGGVLAIMAKTWAKDVKFCPSDKFADERGNWNNYRTSNVRGILSDMANAVFDRKSLLRHNVDLVADNGDRAYGTVLVDNTPTIDPESLRPTAHWISDSAGSTNVVCSACNAISFAAYNFCPECGKRMVSVQKRMVNEDD